MNAGGLSRRGLFRKASIVAAGTLAASATPRTGDAETKRSVKKGRINQSASRWCYRKLTLDQLCTAGAKIGLKGIDLLSPRDFPTLKKHGLICTMTSGSGNLIDKKKHKEAVARIRRSIEANAECGFPNVIALAGYGKGMPADVGLANTVEALKAVASLAEKKKVTVCIEYLNSKVDHKGYMFDNMAWGVEVCKRVDSPNVKILYDIYHAQIMEGDIIRTIKDYAKFIGHYHTGGNPGRNEIDETQELYYPAVMRAIADSGFTGYVAHEFVPKRDPRESLAQAFKICDV
ncbi:MAG: TIM barrel protein [Phycisphaerae bacterium]|jgi:hydroxypyruvate isomerase|nr:TIM barrel protein [Phycisphaerae bacterium]